MILLRVVSSDKAFLPITISYPLSGFVAVIAGVLLFKDIRRSAQYQVSALFFLGVALLLYTQYTGGSFSVTDAFSRNTQLLTMVMSVGFLKLLIDIDPSSAALPKGPKAFLNSLTGLGIFGSVINLSAPIMICDRISTEKPIDLLTARSICLSADAGRGCQPTRRDDIWTSVFGRNHCGNLPGDDTQTPEQDFRIFRIPYVTFKVMATYRIDRNGGSDPGYLPQFAYFNCYICVCACIIDRCATL